MTTSTAASPVDRRYDFVLLFDVADGNPNGDPDAGNLPHRPAIAARSRHRWLPQRKIRNAISVLADGRSGCELYFQTQDAAYENRVLNLQHQRAYDALGLGSGDRKKTKSDDGAKNPKSASDKTNAARQWMCDNFYDIRAFGAVMTTGVNCGQVRGPVQITFARSLDAIVPLEFSITRKSVTTEDDAKKQVDKDGSITGTMGRKNTVPYGLYRFTAS